MKVRTLFSMLMFTALVPVAGSAQTATTETTGKANAQTRIEAAMDAAIRAKIPTALLESKVAEGKAKGVSPDRIAMAVEARLNGLMRASEALKRADVEAASQSELAVSADALEAGVSQNALVKVSRSAPTERRAVAVATLTGLVQLGHASEVALARVSAALGTNAALANLQAEVASQLQAGAGKGNANANAHGGGVIRIR